ncbi:MAG TPA: Gfo/Idh/MocA family oxidoreductase [Polyangiaceae bacterium]
MAKPLRIGLLGTGIAPRQLYLKAFRKLGREGVLEVVACASRQRKNAEKYAADAGIPRVVDDAEALYALPDVEAVVISLPIDLQPRFVLAALAAGKAVLSEKPVGPTVAAAKALIRSAKRYSAPWMVGENFAFMPHAERLVSWVKKGTLGHVRLVQVTQITLTDAKSPYFHTAWRQHPKHIGGFVVDGGVHVANVVRRCFGLPVAVKSLTACFEPTLQPIDTAVAALRFESGTLGTWTSCFSAAYSGPMLRLHGSRASAEFFYDRAQLIQPNVKPPRNDPKADSFEEQFRNFADVVKRGKAPRITPEETLEDLIFLDRIVRRT